MDFSAYSCGSAYDETFAADARPWPRSQELVRRLQSLSYEELQRHQRAADVTLWNMGITFNVYGHQDGIEKVWPFDILPRVISSDEWSWVEAGLTQRIRALNLFIDDVYNGQRIVRDGVVPEELIATAKTLRRECMGFRPPQGVWCHVTGTDLVRDKDGQFYVLEDNLRCPSGVSYVLENREVMRRSFPQVFQGLHVVPIEDYPERLLETLSLTAPPGVAAPSVALLTPGVYNSAYFEHSFLARQMGIELVEGRDLAVIDGYLQMRTTRGLCRVDVLYRRIDDDFLDPRCFRSDSLLGVPGLMDVYRAGRLTLANAPGTGIADDKAVYAYVPDIIRFYLAEEPMLANVPTYVCSNPDQRRYVLDNLAELVIKPTNESGGYGILIGPQASREELARYADLIRSNPRNYIAQPMLTLSTVPTIVEDHLEARHVDLRPFVLYGKDIYVLPGGLTRVALRKGSMIVNSSQGGGSKDTWVVKNGLAPAPPILLAKADPTGGKSVVGGQQAC
jgi:uncharacterized circularly permuted ATP-grasp superfamily protein